MVWEQGGGRPDILGTVGSSAFLVIEAKFDAPLTKSQPVDYVRCLPKNGGGMLLFLVPSARTGEIWRELTKRCNSARISVGDAVSHANGLTTAPLQGTNRLAISSWESLVSTLLNELSGLTDPKAHADVVQLSALVDRLLSGELAGFLPADESRDKRDRQLRAMVDAVVMKLVEAGHRL